jgi:tetratricopeptide (TPR) repeat protein
VRTHITSVEAAFSDLGFASDSRKNYGENQMRPRTLFNQIAPLLVVASTISLFRPTTLFAQDSVSLLLESPNAIKIVAEYLGIIESLDSKVDRLLDADMKTAVALLEQAKANPSKAGELLKDARIFFTRAAEIQSDSMSTSRRNKRALALLGLWSCCQAVGDPPNANLALKKITEIPRELEWFTKELIKTERSALGVLVDHAVMQTLTGGADNKLSGIAYYLDVSVITYRNIDDYRKADRDYDSLLKIQDQVAKKLRKDEERTK